jgi:hypothetical protein
MRPTTKDIRNDFERNDPATMPDDEDADYKPILQGVINTRCNYDGGKIEGVMEL